MLIKSFCVKVCVYFDNKLMRGNRTVKVSAGSLHAFDSPNLSPLAHAMIDIDVDYQNILKPATMTKFKGRNKTLMDDYIYY